MLFVWDGYLAAYHYRDRLAAVKGSDTAQQLSMGARMVAGDIPAPVNAAVHLGLVGTHGLGNVAYEFGLKPWLKNRAARLAAASDAELKSQLLNTTPSVDAARECRVGGYSARAGTAASRAHPGRRRRGDGEARRRSGEFTLRGGTASGRRRCSSAASWPSHASWWCSGCRGHADRVRALHAQWDRGKGPLRHPRDARCDRLATAGRRRQPRVRPNTSTARSKPQGERCPGRGHGRQSTLP